MQIPCRFWENDTFTPIVSGQNVGKKVVPFSVDFWGFGVAQSHHANFWRCHNPQPKMKLFGDEVYRHPKILVPDSYAWVDYYTDAARSFAIVLLRLQGDFYRGVLPRVSQGDMTTGFGRAIYVCKGLLDPI